MIVNVFNALKDFFTYVHVFTEAIWTLMKKAFTLIGYSVSYINLVLHALPLWIWVILTILLSVCILYKVLNKET